MQPTALQRRKSGRSAFFPTCIREAAPNRKLRMRTLLHSANAVAGPGLDVDLAQCVGHKHVDSDRHGLADCLGLCSARAAWVMSAARMGCRRTPADPCDLQQLQLITICEATATHAEPILQQLRSTRIRPGEPAGHKRGKIRQLLIVLVEGAKAVPHRELIVGLRFQLLHSLSQSHLHGDHSLALALLRDNEVQLRVRGGSIILLLLDLWRGGAAREGQFLAAPGAPELEHVLLKQSHPPIELTQDALREPC
mmetsp:Transcript_40778/g.91177  ORF Transcript_40778/g.91177 Transcript_40778/m.91177 type:complete len:252 (-) Transcript_40778:53-808(-)